MEVLFISYALAKKLKEKGFDLKCLAYYSGVNLTYSPVIMGRSFPTKKLEDHEFLAPLYQQVTDWLRNIHEIHIEIDLTDNTTEYYYSYCIINSKVREYDDQDMVDQAMRAYNWDYKSPDYYAALNTAIEDALKQI